MARGVAACGGCGLHVPMPVDHYHGLQRCGDGQGEFVVVGCSGGVEWDVSFPCSKKLELSNGSCVFPCVPLCSHVYPMLPRVPLCSHVYPCVPMCTPMFPCVPLCSHHSINVTSTGLSRMRRLHLEISPLER